jgi:hypothetical protein
MIAQLPILAHAAEANLHECNDRIATFLGICGRQEKGQANSFFGYDFGFAG